MSMMPIWLDDVFKQPGKAPQEFANHPTVKDAFQKAEAAYKEKERINKADPKITGSPEQSARQAFLEALGLEVSAP